MLNFEKLILLISIIVVLRACLVGGVKLFSFDFIAKFFRAAGHMTAGTAAAATGVALEDFYKMFHRQQNCQPDKQDYENIFYHSNLFYRQRGENPSARQNILKKILRRFFFKNRACPAKVSWVKLLRSFENG